MSADSTKLFRFFTPRRGTKLDAIPRPSVVTFRDLDPWYRSARSGHNKFGFLARDGTLFFPRFRGVRKSPYSTISGLDHRVFVLNFESYHEQLDEFFRCNQPSADLFDVGMQALLHGQFSYFDHPIKLPLLAPITSAERKAQWARLVATLAPADFIFTFDSESIVSRSVAWVDRGTWSHVGCYTGDGTICEAITLGVVERPIEVYRRANFRLGIYRAAGIDAERVIAFNRSQLGKPYNYKGVARFGLRKLLGFRTKQTETRKVSPNDLAIRLEPILFL